MTITFTPDAQSPALADQPLRPTKPDLRSALLTLIVTSVATSAVHSELGSTLLFTWSIALCTIFRRRSVLTFVVAFAAIKGGQYLSLLGSSIPGIPYLGISFTLIARAFPIYTAGWALFSHLPIGEVMAALGAMRIPRTVLIVLTVIYRYVPTLWGEMRIILAASRMRHSLPAWRRWLRHPITQCEYLITPVIMRSARVADELSAAAVCRGLDPDDARTCAIVPKLELIDWLLPLATIAVTVLIWNAVG